MKVAIVTDSNSGITLNEAKDLGVHIISMPFLIDGEEYIEEVSLSQEAFYEKLINNANVSTSQPSIYEVGEVWSELLKEYDEIVHIPMSSGLSASCSSAVAKAQEFDNKVQVVDNKRISVTQKQSVLDAVKLAKYGKSAVEIKEYLEKTASDSSIYIMLGTLKYLKKGGRITPAAAAIGTLLKIKPVLTLQGDKLDKFMQVMSFNIGKKRMIDQVESELKTRFDYLVKEGKLVVDIAYTNCLDKALEFKEEVNEMLKNFNMQVNIVAPLSLSVACHIGDGALALAVSRKE